MPVIVVLYVLNIFCNQIQNDPFIQFRTVAFTSTLTVQGDQTLATTRCMKKVTDVVMTQPVKRETVSVDVTVMMDTKVMGSYVLLRWYRRIVMSLSGKTVTFTPSTLMGIRHSGLL